MAYQNTGMTKQQRLAYELEKERVRQGSLGQAIARQLVASAGGLLDRAAARDLQRVLPTPQEQASVYLTTQQGRGAEAQVPGLEAQSRMAGMKAEDLALSRDLSMEVTPWEGLEIQQGTAGQSLLRRVSPLLSTARGAGLVQGTEGVVARLQSEAAARKAAEDRAARLKVAETAAAPKHREVTLKEKQDAFDRADAATAAAAEKLRGARIEHDRLIALPGTNPEEENARFQKEVEDTIGELAKVTSKAQSLGWKPTDVGTKGQEALGREKTAGIAAKQAYHGRGGALGDLAAELGRRTKEQDIVTQARNDVAKQYNATYKPLVDGFVKKDFRGDDVPLNPKTDKALLESKSSSLGKSIASGLRSNDKARKAAAIEAINMLADTLPKTTYDLARGFAIGDGAGINEQAIAKLFDDEQFRTQAYDAQLKALGRGE